MVRATLKVAAVFGLMLGYGVHSLGVGVLVKSSRKRRRRRAELIAKYSRQGLRVLQIQVDEIGQRELRPGTLFVGNHLSYLDVLILAATNPSCFVTSEEVREMPGLGWLCELGGCLFVERRTRARLRAEIGQITEALRQGLQVTIFPEATSTNGDQVLRFRRPLFRAALEARTGVQPFCLNYVSFDGEPVSDANRDSLCWYGDMDFLPHLWRLAQARAVRVELNWLEVLRAHQHEISPRAESVDWDFWVEQLSTTSQQMVSAVFRSLSAPRKEHFNGSTQSDGVAGNGQLAGSQFGGAPRFNLHETASI